MVAASRGAGVVRWGGGEVEGVVEGRWGREGGGMMVDEFVLTHRVPGWG